MGSLTTVQWANLASAGFGAAGTLVLFISSWSKEPREGATWGGPILDAWNKEVDARNRWRRIGQRVGLILLGLAFVFQGVAVFV
jgi:hypothetical protein